MFNNTLRKVLIVEDDGALRGILKSLLGAGYDVAVAQDGVQALERIEFFRPELMLLDLLLPKKNGFEVLEAVRKSSDPQIANMSVLVFSNLNTAAEIAKAKALKVDAYFLKSTLDLQTIKNKIGEILKINPEEMEKSEVMDFTK